MGRDHVIKLVHLEAAFAVVQNEIEVQALK